MSDTLIFNQRLADSDLTIEDRARALRAIHAGEVLGMMLNAASRAVTGLVQNWRHWSEARRSVAYLATLDRRLLADIGLSHATLEESLFRRNRDAGKSSVDVEVTDMMPIRTAANQDHRDQRTAA